MKKPVKTQNSNEPVDDTYKGLIRKVHYLDEHIAVLTHSRSCLIERIKAELNKTDENIEFELNKLRKD